jgi:hypothetical protein
MPRTSAKNEGATTMTTRKHSTGFQTLALSSIQESTTNPRRTFDESKLAELAESLRSQGLIQPITVRPNSEGYEIVAGARRFRAAHLAEMDEVPVRIVQLSDEQAIEWQLVELSIVGKSFLCLHAGPTRCLYVNDVQDQGLELHTKYPSAMRFRRFSPNSDTC